jgi:hypothetical protein
MTVYLEMDGWRKPYEIDPSSIQNGSFWVAIMPPLAILPMDEEKPTTSIYRKYRFRRTGKTWGSIPIYASDYRDTQP